VRWLIAHPGPNFSVHDVWKGWVEALTALGEQVFIFNLDSRLQFYARALFPADDDAVAALGQAEDEGPDDGAVVDVGRPILVRRAVSDQEAVAMAANGLMSNAYQCWPDVVVLVSAFFTHEQMLQVLRARRHKVVIIHTECPYQDEEQLKRAAFADINLINDEASLPAFRELEGRAEYMPHAYRPSVHYPGPADPDQACDLAFVGTGFKSRVEFFDAMDFRGARVRFAGNWTQLPGDHSLGAYLAHARDVCLDNDEAAALYRSAKAGINFYRREGDEHQVQGVSMGPREVEMAACGLWFMRDPRPESDATFPMLPTFSGTGEASELLAWAIAHPAERMAAAAAARAAVAGRTFENHARRLLSMIG
jgi:spore maturation protein CgeB